MAPGKPSSNLFAFSVRKLRLIIVAQMVSLLVSNVSAVLYPNNAIRAAVRTSHSVSVQDIDLPTSPIYQPGTIEVKSDKVPSFVIKFNSVSSKLNLMHQHQPSKVPSLQETFSEDEPHILKHKILKPIIQEVHEIISPYRRIVQEMQPVVETINTIISRNQNETPFQPKRPSFKMNFSIGKKSTESDRASVKDLFAPNAIDSPKKESSVASGPDLVLRENELVDNSLYNGNNELDLKYMSPNLPGNNELLHNEYNDNLYKDR